MAIRKCVECDKEFTCPPSAKTVTCGKECSRSRRSRLLQGHKQTDETKKKISSAAKGRDMTAQQALGTQAAMASPKAGRFETNSSAKRWVLLSPDKQIYECVNLAEFVRKNSELFDIDPNDDKAVNRICHGFFTIKKNIRRKEGTVTYKEWSILNWSDEINKNKKNTAED